MSAKRRNASTNVGKVIQVIGPVVDVEFAEGELPEIYTAIRITSEGFDTPAADPHHRRGGAAPGRGPRPLRFHASDRRPGARHEGRRHRRPDHRARWAAKCWAGS